VDRLAQALVGIDLCPLWTMDSDLHSHLARLLVAVAFRTHLQILAVQSLQQALVFGELPQEGHQMDMVSQGAGDRLVVGCVVAVLAVWSLRVSAAQLLKKCLDSLLSEYPELAFV
jgi:hypothetical protein